MKLEQCTKWELMKLIGSLPNQEEVKRKLSEVERAREYVKSYLKNLKNHKLDAGIYDVRDFKRLGFNLATTANAMKRLNEEYENLINGIMDAIEDVPAADVKKVVHAKWECDGKNLVCTACGTLVLTSCYDYVQYRSVYCPHCGAKMDGDTYER